MNYEAEVVIQAFIRFNPGKTFVLADIEAFDAQLAVNNDAFIIAALQARGITSNGRYDKSRVLQFAVSAPGDFAAALNFGAGAYRRALDVGAIK